MKTLAFRRLSAPFVFGLLLRGTATVAGHPGSSRSLRPRRRVRASRAKRMLAVLALVILSADALFCASGLAAPSAVAPSSNDPVVDPWSATAQQPSATWRERWESLFGASVSLPGPSAARAATEPEQDFFGRFWNSAPAAPAGRGDWLASASSAGTTRGAVTTRSSPGPIRPVTNTAYTQSGDYVVDSTDAPQDTITSIGAGDTFTIAGSLAVGYSHTGSFSQSGGSVTVQASQNNAGFVLGLNAGSSGTYTLTGGTLSAVYGSVGGNGNGTMNQSAGTATFSNTLYVGTASGSNSTYNLSGTGSLSAQVENIGGFSGSSGHFVQSGGTNTAQSLILAQVPGGQGTYLLSGGVLSLSQSLNIYNGTFTQTGGSLTTDAFFLANGNSSNVAAYVMSGGTFSIQPQPLSGADFVLASGGNGTFTQTGGTVAQNGFDFLYLAYNSGNGTYNLNGGTLQAAEVLAFGGGSSVFNFNGGTLQSNGYYPTLMGDLTRANVRAGGAIIDTAGYSVLISQSLVHSNLSGDAATDGGLTKLGAGTLTLSGTNTYTGGTRINAGALVFPQINSMPATGSVTVANGAILGVGVGGPGEYTNAAAGTGSFGALLAGISAQGTPVTYAPGASVGIDTTNAPGGGLTYSNVFANLNNGANALGFAKFGGGTLTLTAANTYTGGTTVSGGTLTVSGSGTFGAAGGAFAVNGGALDLAGRNISAGSVTIAGGTIQNGTLTGTSYDGQSGAASANLAGSIGLTKTTTSTLTLSGTNTYTGTTMVSAGTLDVTGGSTGSLNASLGVSGPVSNNAQVTLRGGTLLASNEVLGSGGSGTFVQNFGPSTNTIAGKLSLGLVPSDTGTYILGNGTLQAAQITGASPTSVFNFQGGTLRAGASDNPSDPNNPTTFFGGAFTVNVRNAPSAIDTNGFNVTMASNLLHSTIAGDRTFDGGLTKNGAGTLTLTGTNTYNGGTTVNAGTLQGNTASLQGYIRNNANLVFDQAADGTFAGTVASPGTFTKTGAGTLTLTGGNPYTGQTVVNQGTLAVINGGGIGAAGATSNLFVNLGNGGMSTAPALTLSGDGAQVFFNNAFIGSTAAGGVSQSGGTFTTGNVLYLGYSGTSATTGNGTYTLTGGTLNTRETQVGNGGTGTFTQSDGTQTVTTTLYLGLNGGTGTYNLSGGGTLQASSGVVGYTGTGAFNQSGGTANFGTGGLTVGSVAGSQGTYGLGTGSSGGATASLNSSGPIYVGYSGTGTFNQQAGGSLFTNGNALYLGYNAGSVGTFNLSGGEVDTADGSTVGYAGTGTFNHTGGANIVAGTLVLGHAAGSSGTYNLGGGALVAAQVGTQGGTSTFNFNGGTLVPTANRTDFFQGLTTANVRNGGATIDTQGFNVTVAQPLLHSSIAGDNGVDGGLTKLNAGTLTLTGINTYNGGTTLNAGTLILGNGTGAAALRGADGASGTAVSVNNATTFQVQAQAIVTGGSGTGGGSTGTSGGTGVSFSAGGILTNKGTVSGGSGGNGFLVGGSGGTGVSFAGGGTLTNAGTVNGGSGGSGSFQGGSVGTGVRFSGGVGTLTNQQGGTIGGGVSMDGNFANAVTLQSGSTVNGNLNVGSNAGSTLTLTDHGTGGSQLYSQAVTGATSFNGALLKTGTGTWSLDQALGYAGGTTVAAGTLLANNTSGSATGSGAVQVQGGAILGGSGTVGGNVVAQSGATVVPGAASLASFARLTLGGTLTLQSNSLLAIKLGGVTGGTGYDQVFAAGGFTLGGNLQLSLVNGFTPTLNQSFTILDNTGVGLNSGTFANAPGGLYTDAAGDRFLINYAAIADGDLVPNDVTLTYVGTVPEPGTWTFLLAASSLYAGWMIRARRNRPA